MKLPTIWKRPTASTSTADDIAAEIERLDGVRAAAEQELFRLGDQRPELLITASNDELARHDAGMAVCRRDIEQAAARIAVLEPEMAEARRLADDTSDRELRTRLYSRAKVARREGLDALKLYEVQVRALAETLQKISDAGREVGAANDRLPEGAKPIECVEPFNGTADTPGRPAPLIEIWVDPETGSNFGSFLPGGVVGAVRKMVKGYGPSWIEGQPGRAHRPLADRVALPHIDPAKGWIWRGEETRQERNPDRDAALRFLGIAR